MPSFKYPLPSASEITPKSVYLNRRSFIKAAGFVGLGTLASQSAFAAPLEGSPSAYDPMEKTTPREDFVTYNNFYEFGMSKSDPYNHSKDFTARPWLLQIDGLVEKPLTIDIDELIATSDIQERLYRMRCVEAWSMVVPWLGIQMSDILARVQPTSAAKYVAFTSIMRPEEMPGQSDPYNVIRWPYVEGLRLDEAMNPLTILSVGAYGETLQNQNGAPIRLVVPWKYGFKGIKSIQKITLTDVEPPTSWNILARNEYGFYANVNPNVDHPRWSQATERRIGEGGFFSANRRDTLMFNGYEEQVAHMYAGMDLKANY